jgi:hypothetical protein
MYQHAKRWMQFAEYILTPFLKNKVMWLLSLEENYFIHQFRMFNYARVLGQVSMD